MNGHNTTYRMKREYPLVCRIRPNVCGINPIMCPHVGILTPFVCSIAPKSTRGFSLIELVVTVLIAAILVGVAVPTMRTTIQNNRLATVTNDLISDINLARSEALRRGRNIALCMSASGAACDGLTWQAGRMIFVDANDNTVYDANEEILRVRNALPSNTLTSALAPSPLIFNFRGLPANAPLGATFAVCDERGAAHGRALVMTPTGNIGRDIINPLGGC